MNRLFVYGTLQFPEVVERLLGYRLVGCEAALYGYDSLQLKCHPYPAAFACGRAKLHGVLYSGISPKQLRLLDRYEGNIYLRKRVKIVLPDKHIHSAWVYVIADHYRKALSNMKWDKQEFATKHLRQYLKKYC